MKIPTRFAAVSLVSAIAAGLIGAVLITTTAQVTDELEKNRAAADILVVTAGLRYLAFEYTLRPEARVLQQWKSRNVALGEMLAVHNGLYAGKAPASLRKLRATHQEIAPLFMQLMEAQQALRSGDAQRVIVDELVRRLASSLVNRVTTMIGDAAQLQEISREKVTHAQRNAESAVIALSAGLAIIVAALMFFTFLSIMRPLARLREGTRLISAGRLDHTIGLTTKDELGELARAFDQMTGKLRDTTVSRDELAAEMTERQRVEDLHSQLAEVVESSDEAIISKSRDGTILSWNRGAEKLFGYSAQEAVGQPMLMLFPPELADQESDLLARIVRGESVGQFETIRLRKGGDRIDVAVTLSPVRNSQGNIVGASSIARDISARKQAEIERDRFFSLSLDPLCIAKGDGYFHRLNPAFERILGFSMEEMLARPFMEFIHPDDRASTMAVVEQLATGVELVNFENRYLCKDGSYRWFLWMCVPYEGFLYATARDITERRQHEAEIQTLNASLEQRVVERTAQLEAANQELEAFSYSVSHDLRAPLRGIDSFSKMVIEDYGPKLDADGQRQLNVIRSEAQRMGQLIDELLSFSRLGRQEVRSALFEMNPLVQSVFDELPASARERVRQFKIHPLPNAYGDRAMIRQVLVNLISNAVKFSGQVADPEIEISGDTVDGWTTYRVKDNGVGFDPRYAHKLFGVFQRLHAEHEFEGTGVGLAIVQRVIHRHGGKAAAVGVPNRGATFSFTLPAKDEPGKET